MNQGTKGEVDAGEVTAVVVGAGGIGALEDFDQVGEADFGEEQESIVGIGPSQAPTLPAVPGEGDEHADDENAHGEVQLASLELHAEP